MGQPPYECLRWRVVERTMGQPPYECLKWEVVERTMGQPLYVFQMEVLMPHERARVRACLSSLLPKHAKHATCFFCNNSHLNFGTRTVVAHCTFFNYWNTYSGCPSYVQQLPTSNTRTVVAPSYVQQLPSQTLPSQLGTRTVVAPLYVLQLNPYSNNGCKHSYGGCPNGRTFNNSNVLWLPIVRC